MHALRIMVANHYHRSEPARRLPVYTARRKTLVLHARAEIRSKKQSQDLPIPRGKANLWVGKQHSGSEHRSLVPIII